MDKLQDSIKELNNNIVNLNRNILALLAGSGGGGSGTGFSVEILKDALLNVEVQDLLTEIVNYNQYNRKPLVKEDRKPLENIPTEQVVQQKEAVTRQEAQVIQQKSVKQKKIIQKTVKEDLPEFEGELVETIYTVKSPKNGYFVKTEKNNNIFKTQYQINVFGEEGEFFIPENIDALRLVLSPEKFLEQACTGDYDFNGTKDKLKKIETLKKGIVKKDANGWKIIRKAVIRVVKE